MESPRLSTEDNYIWNFTELSHLQLQTVAEKNQPKNTLKLFVVTFQNRKDFLKLIVILYDKLNFFSKFSLASLYIYFPIQTIYMTLL